MVSKVKLEERMMVVADYHTAINFNLEFKTKAGDAEEIQDSVTAYIDKQIHEKGEAYSFIQSVLMQNDKDYAGKFYVDSISCTILSETPCEYNDIEGYCDYYVAIVVTVEPVVLA